MTLLPTLLLFLAARAGDPPRAEAAPRDGRLVAGVVVVVNGDVVTIADAARAVDELRRRTEVTTEADLEEVQGAALRRTVVELLRIQAGEDLGLAPEELERRVAQLMRRQREERGLPGQADYLRSLGLDAAGARADTQDLLHNATWFLGIVGLGPGSRGRLVRDRFVRPGEILAAHRELARSSHADQVVLQVLEIRTAALGSVENARTLARELQERAQAGESFDALVDEYGALSRATRGVQPKTPAGRAPPPLRAFALEAEEGEISDVVPASPGDSPYGYWVAKLLERQAGPPPPPIEDAKTQEDLVRGIQNAREGFWLEEAETALRRRAWIWPTAPEDPRRGAAPR